MTNATSIGGTNKENGWIQQDTTTCATHQRYAMDIYNMLIECTDGRWETPRLSQMKTQLNVRRGWSNIGLPKFKDRLENLHGGQKHQRSQLTFANDITNNETHSRYEPTPRFPQHIGAMLQMIACTTRDDYSKCESHSDAKQDVLRSEFTRTDFICKQTPRCPRRT